MQTATLASLPAGEVRARLRGSGLAIATGPLTVRIRTRESAVAEALSLQYHNHPLGSDEFADFHVEIQRARGLRGHIKAQVEFVVDGRRPFKPLPLAQAYAMLEWGLNWCIAANCHQYLVIHAGVIERNGCAAILPAPPASGKSTLTAALIHRGWRLLSDELTLLDPATGEVHALARPVNLKNRSIDVIRAFAPEAVFGAELPDTHKGRIAHLRAPADSVAQLDRRAKPRWIIFPRWQAEAATELVSQPKSQSFIRLAENAFNYTQLGETGFNTLADAISCCDCLSLHYSQLDEAIAVFERLAEGA